MKPANEWLFPGTSIETVLKTRPLAASLFERLGLNPWKALHAGVGDLCTKSGVSWQEFLRGVESLPEPAAGSDWSSLPIFHLLDFLSCEHREFLHGYLPAIGHVLSDIPDADSESLRHLRILALEWPAFATGLNAHIREEEDTLFLRLLRYDACKRLGTAQPEFEGGSVRVFTVVSMLEHEHRDMALFRRFLAKALPDFPRPDGDVLEMRLRPLLGRFQAALGRHARLETEVLFPWGISLEKALYDLHIRGKLVSREDDAVFSASTRG